MNQNNIISNLVANNTSTNTTEEALIFRQVFNNIMTVFEVGICLVIILLAISLILKTIYFRRRLIDYNEGKIQEDKEKIKKEISKFNTWFIIKISIIIILLTWIFILLNFNPNITTV